MSLLGRFRLLRTLGRGVVQGLPDPREGVDPIELLERWWRAAEDAGILLPESAALATATAEGVPSVRMVLLKMLDARGLVFYTNYESRKAGELDENPVAAMCFHWAVLQRQVRVTGPVERVPHDEAAAYFATRTRGSQIGAWASRQSEELPTRAELEARVEAATAEYRGRDVPLPPFWGGYRLSPERIEFWQGRTDRLHDRLLFERDAEGDTWSVRRLYP